MKDFRHIFFLIALLIPLLLNANNDSIRKRFQDNSSFVGNKWGDDSLNLYKGKHVDLNFTQALGFFKIQGEEIVPLHVRVVNGASDTCFLNINIWENSWINESFNQTNYKCLEIRGDTKPQFLKSKQYNYSEKKWYIQTKSDDYVWGHRYDTSLDYLDDLSEDYNIDKYMLYMVFAILISCALWAILSPLVGEKKWQLNPGRCIVCSLLFVIASLFIVDRWTQLQLFWPLMSLWILFALIRLYKVENLKVAIFHLCVSFIIVLGWGYFQFYSLESNVNLSDDVNVHIHWRKGTDWMKRIVIKRILRNMVPVPVNDHSTSYLVYASKYEFTEGELAILNDDLFGWIPYVFYDDALTGLSFREAQLILQKIEDLSGVKFDFFTYPEWLSASLGIAHTCNEYELEDVDKGLPNAYGLVHIASNAPEFTSSYYPTIKLGVKADTLIGAVNNVYVAGNAYVDNNSINYSLVNKNLREGAVGLRLIYRPHQIGARKFSIKGYKCNTNNIPLEKLWVSIDGRLITSFPNYESFEEYLIEHFYETKHIGTLNQQTNKVEDIIIPPGWGLYDIVPSFIFYGIENESAIINI